MTKKQILFWRLILGTILLGGAILVGRIIHKDQDKAQVDAITSEFVDPTDEDMATTDGTESAVLEDTSTGTTENVDSFDEDFKDDENSSSDSSDIDSNNDVDSDDQNKDTVEEPKKEEKVKPIVDQTINLSIRSENFFESPEDIDQDKANEYDQLEQNDNKKSENDNVTPSKKIHSLKNQEDQENN